MNIPLENNESRNYRSLPEDEMYVGQQIEVDQKQYVINSNQANLLSHHRFIGTIMSRPEINGSPQFWPVQNNLSKVIHIISPGSRTIAMLVKQPGSNGDTHHQSSLVNSEVTRIFTLEAET